MTQDVYWMEVSLTVNGELAEAVAEVLSRFAPGGVVIESTKISSSPDHLGRPSGPLRVIAYFPDDHQFETTRQQLETAFWYLGRIHPLPKAIYRSFQGADWTRAWKKNYHPVQIGERLVVIPAWMEHISPSGRTPIYIEPGMAFGTGTHPTTQLCMTSLEQLIEIGQPVIDVGCGSGILSITAIKLGADQVLGVDTDPQAIHSARTNAEINGIDKSQLALELGSLEEILTGKFSLRQAPLVLVNLLTPVIIQMLNHGLADVVTHDGVLILSGILETQEQEVLAVMESHQLALHQRQTIDDWVCFVVGHEFTSSR